MLLTETATVKTAVIVHHVCLPDSRWNVMIYSKILSMIQLRIVRMMINYDRMRLIIQKTRFHTLNHVAKNERFDFPAVYLIYSPNRCDLFYIGATNSLKSRIEEHVFGIGIGNLCSKIKRRSEMPQDVSDYKLKYIRIDDYRERQFSECLLLGTYAPMLNFTR